jgi:hypothetical protein
VFPGRRGEPVDASREQAGHCVAAGSGCFGKSMPALDSSAAAAPCRGHRRLATNMDCQPEGTEMSESRLFKVILIVLALTLVVFGGWRFINPIGFYTFSGLDLAGDAGLLSEVRGAGGIIMVSGFVVGLGAVQHAWSRTSVLLAALVFLSLGLGRLMGIALDGLPGAEVIQGLAIELVFGILALFAFFRYRETPGALRARAQSV